MLSAAGGLRAGLSSEGPLPSRRAIRTLVEELIEVLFPESHRLGTDGGSLRDHVAATIASLEPHLEEAIYLGLHRLHRKRANGRATDPCGRRAKAMAGKLLRLPDIALLAKDVLAAFDKKQDPAASGIDEIVACYPGLYAIAVYRVAHRLLAYGGEVLPRHADGARPLANGNRHSPRREIWDVVLHRSLHRNRHRRDLRYRRLGTHLSKCDAGGALGPRFRSRDDKPTNKKRHPTIEDDVTIYTNATILGGPRTVIWARRGGGRQRLDRPSPSRPECGWGWGPYASLSRFSCSADDPRGDPALLLLTIPTVSSLSRLASGAACQPRHRRCSESGALGVADLSSRITDLLREVSAQILEAQRPIRVLRLLAWTPDVERAFFAAKGRELPRPEYRVPPEVIEVGVRFRALKASIVGEGAVQAFLRDTCDAFATAARMLAAAGTRDFYHHSVELYGRPASLTADRRTTDLDLAEHFSRVVDGITGRRRFRARSMSWSIRPRRCVPSSRRPVRAIFSGPRHPGGGLLDDIASKAAAGVDGVRIKRGVRFSRRDLAQLEFHEGHVHVATALNGRAQPILSFTGWPSPRTTATQEGLAVLTEFLTQSTSIERIAAARRPDLGHQDGGGGGRLLPALSILSRPRSPTSWPPTTARAASAAGDWSWRPVRRNSAYLDGLLRVTNFLRVALVKGHLEYVPLFFAGKIEVEDVPLVGRLVREGLARPPEYARLGARPLVAHRLHELFGVPRRVRFRARAAALRRPHCGAEDELA